MLRIASVMLVFVLMAMVQSAEAKDSKESAEIRAWCEEIEGNTYWLRIDVIRVDRCDECVPGRQSVFSRFDFEGKADQRADAE